MADESTLTNSQLRMMRSLISPGGWEASLVGHLLSRSGGNLEEWESLVTLGLVDAADITDDRGGVVRRWFMTREGWRRYKLEKKGRWF